MPRPKKNILDVETIIELMPAHIYWKDLNGVILGCNKQQAISYGFKNPSEMIGKNDYDLLSYDQAKFITEIDQQVIKNREVKTAEEEISL